MYTNYRTCLRWEFGFACAFCLLHESDLLEHGVEGSGLTSIEHHIARSEDPSLRDEYRNCFYACRSCNGARRDSPRVDRNGRRLLEPCSATWAQHFFLNGDELLPRPGDDDAAYTWEAYDLGDRSKAELRRDRRLRIDQSFDAMRRLPPLIQQLMELADTSNIEESAPLVEAAGQLQSMLRSALRELNRYAAVPKDHDASCHCFGKTKLALPDFLTAQLVDHPAP